MFNSSAQIIPLTQPLLKKHCSLAIATFTLLQILLVQQTSAASWYTHIYAGLSQLSDQSFTVEGIPSVATGDASISGGFTSGLAFGYNTNTALRAEFGWEYRSNESSSKFNSGASFPEGNYASNVFYLNGLYRFRSADRFEPFAGAGLVWVQEIDIDLESNGLEQSFSGDGDIGWQLIAGTDYQFARSWQMRLEARYSFIDNIDLTQEGGNSSLKGLEYQPITLQAGLSYSF